MKFMVMFSNRKHQVVYLPTLEDAKLYADTNVELTGENMVILDWEMCPPKVVAKRQWIPHPATVEEQGVNIIDFGQFGFYDAWVY